MTNRINCIVDGCRRGMGKATAIKRWGTCDVSLICGVHWNRLTKSEKRVWARIRRLERKLGCNLGDRSYRIWAALARRSK